MATPGPARHRDLEQRLRNIEAAVQQVRGVIARRPKFEVSDGDLTVDGGDVLMLDTDGSVLFRLGTQEQGDRGITIWRDDASLALGLRKPFDPSDSQILQLLDNEENVIFQEEVFGTGLGKPYLPVPLQPVGGTATAGTYGWERSVTSATFVDVFRWEGVRQNRWYRPVLNVRTSDGTTAGEVQVVDGSGTVLSGFFQPTWTATIAAGVTTDRETKPPYGLGFTADVDAVQVVRVQARRTAGAGTLSVSVRASEGGEA